MQLLNDWLRSKHEKTPRLGGTDKTTTHTKRTIAFNIGNNDKKKKTNTQTTYKYCTSRQPDLKFKDTKDKEIHFQWNQSNHELKQNKKQGRKKKHKQERRRCNEESKREGIAHKLTQYETETNS